MVKNVPRAPFSKPESVLEQAEGPSLEHFESWAVGQTHATLQSLTEMFTSK
jgi:translation initiation factor 3 subunit A